MIFLEVPLKYVHVDLVVIIFILLKYFDITGYRVPTYCIFYHVNRVMILMCE